MIDSNLKSICASAKSIAMAAGEIIRKHREAKDFSVKAKSHGINYVTSVDLEVDSLIISLIRQSYPHDQILTEESFHKEQKFDYSRPLWVIDPIDGTTNFMYGLNEVVVSIAYMDQFELKAAANYFPFTGEMFWAIRNHGAYLGEERIYASDLPLRKSLVHLGVTSERTDQDVKEFLERSEKVIARCKNFRRYGASAVHLSYMACGRCHGTCETVKPWDVAAGFLILKEAGGRVCSLAEPDLQKDKLYWFDKMEAWLPGEIYSKDIVAGAPGMFAEFLEILKS